MTAIRVTGIDVGISKGLGEHIAQRFAPCERYCDELERLDVTIRRRPQFGYRVDVAAHRRSGEQLVVHEEAEHVLSAVTQARDTCRKRLRRLHDRRVRPQRTEERKVVS